MPLDARDLVGKSPTPEGETYGPPAPDPSLTGGPRTKVQDGQVWQWVEGVDLLGEPTGRGTWERVASAPDAPGGGGEGRNDALTAASTALSGFLQAQSLADARKLSAMQQFQDIAKFALPPGVKDAPGYEPGGLAQTLAARQGLGSYRPPAITTRTVDPSSLETPGKIPPEVQQMLAAIRGAGGG